MAMITIMLRTVTLKLTTNRYFIAGSVLRVRTAATATKTIH
jgi:hypothetical protein